MAKKLTKKQIAETKRWALFADRETLKIHIEPLPSTFHHKYIHDSIDALGPGKVMVYNAFLYFGSRQACEAVAGQICSELVNDAKRRISLLEALRESKWGIL